MQNGKAVCKAVLAKAMRKKVQQGQKEYCFKQSRYRSNKKANAPGQGVFLGDCKYGCYVRNNLAYCRCAYGLKGGEQFCAGPYRYRSNLSIDQYGAGSYLGRCSKTCFIQDNKAMCEKEASKNK